MSFLNEMKTKFYKEKYIYIILSLTLVIDAITGIILNVFKFERSPIGIVFRMFVFGYFLLYSILHNKKNLYTFAVIVICIMINIGYSYLNFHNSMNGVVFDIVENVKILLAPTIVWGSLCLAKDKVISRQTFTKVIYLSVYILVAIYFLGLILGIGNSTYGDGTGYKSLFNANNSLNIVAIVLFIFQVEKTFKEVKIINIALSLTLVIILLMLGSKTSIMFIPIYFILKVILDYKYIDFKKIIKPASIIIGAVILIVVVFFRDAMISIINRQLYFLKRELDSLITYFLSGRDTFLIAASSNYFSRFTIVTVLFGVGMYFNQWAIANTLGFNTIKNIEMDLFDIFFSNGVIGILVTYGYFIYIFVKNFKMNLANRRVAEIISFIAMIIFSLLAGHVFPDAMSATFIAMIVTLICLE